MLSDKSIQELMDRLEKEEGYRQFPYKDSLGILTIGIGRNLESNGISEAEAKYLLANDIHIAMAALNYAYPNFRKWPENVQIVLIDMTFNMGISKVKEFHHMMNYIESGDYKTASEEMLNSKWAHQVGERAINLSKLMST